MLQQITNLLTFLPDPENNKNANTLQHITVLIIFLLVVMIAIYLISTLLILLRKSKQIIKQKNTTKVYYLTVLFYIITKMILCSVLLIQILSQIPNQWDNLDGEDIEIVLKNSILLADLSIIQLFLISLYFYLKVCFISMGKDQQIKIRNILFYSVKSMIIIAALAFIIPLLIFDFKKINYQILNAIAAAFNGSVLLLFLVSFFYLNFKMTGLLVQNRLNVAIKKLYKVLCVILISRILMLAIQITIALKINDGSFASFVQIFQQINGQFAAFGLCFVGAILIILLTQGLPIMYSLRNSVVQSFSLGSTIRQKYQSQQSIITSNTSVIRQQLLNDEDFQYDQQSQQNNQTNHGHSTKNISISSFKNLHQIKSKQNSIWILKRGQLNKQQYILKIAKHQISNYILQDIQTEITKWNQLKLVHLATLSYFKDKQFICIVQKYYYYNLDLLVDKCQNDKQIYGLALEIAQGVEELHKHDIPHGGLKPSYLLFDQNKKLYFTGLGLQSFKKYLSLITGYTNKNMYTAVQLLSDKNNVIIKPKKQNDIYSLGMIFYQMITRNRLYRQQTVKQCRDRFFQEKSRPKIPENINSRIKALIRVCWQDQATKRPNISQVVTTLRKVIDQY